MVYEALVIGGGINGLSALYHLHRLGCRRLGLVERFRPGHSRGSSHGHSRVTRSAYVDPGYVRLMQVVHGQEWPRLERDVGRTLIHRTPGCFYGSPGGKYERYARAVAEAGADVEQIGVTEARRRFPQLRFEGAGGVLHDHTAGLVAAAETISALIDLCRRNGVEAYEETRVLGIDLARDPIRVETDRGPLEAERLVVTAGSWASELLPFLRQRLKVIRQAVFYFKADGPAEDFQVGRFPVWGYFGDGENNIYYGLPAFGREGFKAARHITSGSGDDPEEVPERVDEREIGLVRAFLDREFIPRIERLLDAETCLYTMTGTEDFIIDLHPDNPRVAVGASCSGHGFKFGPLTGRVLAELALKGRTEVPEFEAMRGRFAIKPI